jgi:hypothetical protein
MESTTLVGTSVPGQYVAVLMTLLDGTRHLASRA